ncbi:MAG: CoA transferase [Desulfuromonadales bacterium]|nr:CoA transferase [Desulfuromonadales bacterium]
MKKLLDGIKVVTLAVNLPGPAAARRLCQLGAQVVKVEPPSGDPMNHFHADWYEQLKVGQQLIKIDLKSNEGRRQLDSLLQEADLLITANRPAALERLGLGWDDLHQQFPQLCQVAIVGYPAPRENEPGHDLTYQAKNGLLNPPQMPRTLIADMAGGEKAVSEALALLWARDHGQEAGYRAVALSDAADYMAEPWTVGFTTPESFVGGALAEYNLYQASDGWVAVAALEPHFKRALEDALEVTADSPEILRPIFAQKTASAWEEWAKEYDLPVIAVR